MYKFNFLVSFLIFIQSYSQPISFSEIDSYAKNLPKSEAKSVTQLAKSLAKNCKTDIEKVRAFYVWISENIVYDFAGFKSGRVPEQTANSAFLSQRAVCLGYSELFYTLCKLNSIDCYVVSGYSKGFGYKLGKKFLNTDHAWNAVKLAGKWRLVDATWGSGYIDENEKYVNQFTEEHFLTSPQKFILKHLPSDPIWQLMPQPISIKSFEKDSLEIKKIVENQSVATTNYLDSLKNFEALDSVGRIINSSQRIIKYNPENSDAWYKLGWFYFQRAWQDMAQLNNPLVQKNKSLARPLAQSAIDNQKEALKYLNGVNKNDAFYSEDVKQKKQIIAQNMKNLEQLVK